MSSKVFQSLAEEGYKLALIEKHWTKPIRIIFKGIIACLM
jgi:hypothetical protein